MTTTKKTRTINLTLPVETLAELRLRGPVGEAIRRALREVGYTVPEVVPGNPALVKGAGDVD